MRSKYEVKCQKELEAEGYSVDYKIRPSRFYAGQQIDFFGLFDIIAIKKGKSIKWISVKGHAGVPRKHREEVEKFWLPKNNVKEIWSWGRNKKWKKVTLQ